jgi:TonB family protein
VVAWWRGGRKIESGGVEKSEPAQSSFKKGRRLQNSQGDWILARDSTFSGRVAREDKAAGDNVRVLRVCGLVGFLMIGSLSRGEADVSTSRVSKSGEEVAQSTTGNVPARMLSEPDIERICPYPIEAQKRHEEGVTKVRIATDATGTVTSASVLVSSGSAQLDSAALECIKKRALHRPPTTVSRSCLRERLPGDGCMFRRHCRRAINPLAPRMRLACPASSVP